MEDFASGDRTELGAGQSASSAPARKVGLSVAGKTKPVVSPGAKRAPAFETPAVKNVPAHSGAANAQADGPSGNVGASHAGSASSASKAGNAANSGAGGNANAGGSSNSGGNGASGGSGGSAGSGSDNSGSSGNAGSNGKNR
ncbi:hypothetical protein QW131_07220 [Roseibium salinum]|nr:hypothetical protein [Roseibium salinum]